MNIMACAPHPDDEVMCAGTLAKYARNGHTTVIVFVTNGEVGSEVLSKQEIAAVREQEARASAAVIGAQCFWMGFPDEFLYPDETTRLQMIDVIRQFQPDIIICPDKDADYHPDHISTGQLIWDARVMTTVPNIATDHPPCRNIPEIFYMDTVAGVNFHPELYVDISECWEEKAAMLACHTSQQGWLEAQYGIAHEEFVRIHAMFRGFQAGCRYAEAFRKPKFFPSRIEAAGLL